MKNQASRTRASLIALLLSLAIPQVEAQSAQTWSVQGSFLLTNQGINGSPIAGTGFEGQVRLTPSQWSFGIGFQQTTHETNGESLTLTGLFLEPRFALDIGSDRWSPYLAGRIALLRQSSSLRVGLLLSDFASRGSALGAGGGILYAVTPRVNLDFGAGIVRQSFNDATNTLATVQFSSFFGYVAKLSVSVGL